MKPASEYLISLGIDDNNEAAAEVVNEARKEAIEAAANLIPAPSREEWEVKSGAILSLINELK